MKKIILLFLIVLTCGCGKQEFSMDKCYDDCLNRPFFEEAIEEFFGIRGKILGNCLDSCQAQYYKPKITPVEGRQTDDCRITECIMPGMFYGKEVCTYYWIECNGKRYWAWGAWNDETHEGNEHIWIDGNQYYKNEPSEPYD